jgi:hypothetical protein
LPRDIDIYISGYAPGKILYINVYYFDEPVSTASLTPNQTGWFTITVIGGSVGCFDEMEIKTDGSVLGSIGIAEFHIKQ